jgi:DmsE family decaheme c-type cytochrome
MRTLLLLPLLAGALSAQSHTAAPAASNFVGANVCKTCHADIWQPFFKNPHYVSIASGKEPPDRTGCEGCHGPGRAHVAAGGGRNTIPRAFSLMSPEQGMNTCLTCHAKDLSKANIRRSEHTLENVVCTNCHSIHHSPTPKFLLAKQQNEMCYTCHATVRAEFSMPNKHRVNEGFMQCTDCHNPHGTFEATWRMAQRPRLVEQALNSEEACIKCHVEKRGPFAFEHPPVRVEGCEVCHYPHGSTNAKLLRRPVVFTVCLECHNGADNLGTRNNGVPLQTSRHNLLDPKFQKCVTCHVAIHGSNSDPFFLR